jgi:hypothetical protein
MLPLSEPRKASPPASPTRTTFDLDMRAMFHLKDLILEGECVLNATTLWSVARTTFGAVQGRRQRIVVAKCATC